MLGEPVTQRLELPGDLAVPQRFGHRRQPLAPGVARDQLAGLEPERVPVPGVDPPELAGCGRRPGLPGRLRHALPAYHGPISVAARSHYVMAPMERERSTTVG